MNNDTALILLLADLQREVETLRGKLQAAEREAHEPRAQVSDE